MVDWTYFQIPANIQRKITRHSTRFEAVEICAKNMLMHKEPSEGLGSLTSKEKMLGRALADFWSTKYKKSLKNSPKGVSPGTYWTNAYGNLSEIALGRDSLFENSDSFTFKKQFSSSCTICNGKKTLFDGQNEYLCPACGKKKRSKRSVPKLGARKVRVCEERDET